MVLPVKELTMAIFSKQATQAFETGYPRKSDDDRSTHEIMQDHLATPTFVMYDYYISGNFLFKVEEFPMVKVTKVLKVPYLHKSVSQRMQKLFQCCKEEAYFRFLVSFIHFNYKGTYYPYTKAIREFFSEKNCFGINGYGQVISFYRLKKADKDKKPKQIIIPQEIVAKFLTLKEVFPQDTPHFKAKGLIVRIFNYSFHVKDSLFVFGQWCIRLNGNTIEDIFLIPFLSLHARKRMKKYFFVDDYEQQLEVAIHDRFDATEISDIELLEKGFYATRYGKVLFFLTGTRLYVTCLLGREIITVHDLDKYDISQVGTPLIL